MRINSYALRITHYALRITHYALLNSFPRLQLYHLAVVAARGEFFAQGTGAAREDREGGVVAWDDHLHAKHLAGIGGLARVHGVVVADGQYRQLRAVHLAVQAQVAEEGGVARVVDAEAILHLQQVAHRLAAVHYRPVIL